MARSSKLGEGEWPGVETGLPSEENSTGVILPDRRDGLESYFSFV